MTAGNEKGNDDLKKLVGERIKELRVKQLWNQQSLASKAQLTQSAIAQFERGDRLPSTTALQNIAKAFGVSMESLLSEETNTDIEKIKQLRALMEEAKSLSAPQILSLNRLVKEWKPGGE